MKKKLQSPKSTVKTRRYGYREKIIGYQTWKFDLALKSLRKKIKI